MVTTLLFILHEEWRKSAIFKASSDLPHTLLSEICIKRNKFMFVTRKFVDYLIIKFVYIY